MKNSKQSGFTIVELLIIIVVIGVLAAVSYVAYSSIQSRARTAVVTNALSQAKTKLDVYRVENGRYPTSSNFSLAGIPQDASLNYQYVSADGSAYCLTASNSDILYGATSSTPPTANGCSDNKWLGNATMTNLVTNGDFSNGLNGWSVDGRSTMSLVDGYGQFVGSGTYGNYEVVFSKPSSSIIGHVYYSRLNIRTPSGIPHFTMIWYGDADKYLYSTMINTTQNTWMTRSSLWPAVYASNTSYVRIDWRTEEAQLGKITHLDNFVLIDLTASFGAGNEPTKEQMDAVMQRFPNGYFSGTVSASS